MNRYNGPLAVLPRRLLAYEVEDPWSNLLSEEELDQIFEEGHEICVNCVHPDSNPRWFCDHCGCPTGRYSPYMPFIYLYWMGWLFRSGVDGSVKLTKFRAWGFVIAALGQYSIFFPLYLYWLWKSSNGRYIQDNKIEDEKTKRGPYEYENSAWKSFEEFTNGLIAKPTLNASRNSFSK